MQVTWSICTIIRTRIQLRQRGAAKTQPLVLRMACWRAHRALPSAHRSANATALHDSRSFTSLRFGQQIAVCSAEQSSRSRVFTFCCPVPVSARSAVRASKVINAAHSAAPILVVACLALVYFIQVFVYGIRGVMGLLGGSPSKVVATEAGPTMTFLTNDKQAPSFPVSKDKMIELVKELVKHKFGSEKPELLADDFQFRFPVVELGKKEFIQAFGSFKLDQAFPDMVTEYYGFRLDPHIPGRIWYDTIGGGTHTGPMGGPFKRVKPTGKTISLPPQTSSMTFNEQGQLTYFTGGYVVDRRMGNTGGLGGVFGILHGIGYTLPFPEGKPFRLSWQFRFFRFMGQVGKFISGLLFGSKYKSE